MLCKFLNWLLGPSTLTEFATEKAVKEVTVLRNLPPTPEEDVPDEVKTFKPTLKVYAYFNGQEMVKADPQVLFKQWGQVAGDLDVDFTIIRSGSKDADQAYEKALGRIRSVFNILPMDQGGLDEDSTFELFYHFVNYIAEVKKNSRDSVTKSATTASPPPPSSDVPLPN